MVATAATAAYYGSGLVLPARRAQWIPWACVGHRLASDSHSPGRARIPGPAPGLARLVIVIGLASAASCS